MLEHTDLDEVWFVVSPHNPLKDRKSLLDDQARLEMVRLAIHDDYRMRACDIEFRLPRPSYTILTLTRLGEIYNDKQFSLIMGSDNLDTFDKWRNYQHILDQYHIYVYPRPNHTGEKFIGHPHVTMVEVPTMDISSTYIRNQIKDGYDVKHLLPPPVYTYLTEMHYYETGLSKPKS